MCFISSVYIELLYFVHINASLDMFTCNDRDKIHSLFILASRVCVAVFVYLCHLAVRIKLIG